MMVGAGGDATVVALAGLQGLEVSTLAGRETLPLIASLTLGMLLLALVQACLALAFRRRAAKRLERFEARAALWDPAILAYLFGDVPETAVHRLVESDDQAMFVDALSFECVQEEGRK